MIGRNNGNGKNRSLSYFNGYGSFLPFTAATELIFLRNFYRLRTTEFYNGRRRNGNGRTATEWWKPGKLCTDAALTTSLGSSFQ